MDYGLEQVIESKRKSGETPPRWLRMGVYLSLIGAVYMYGVMNGIQLGAAAQSLGTVNVPPVFIELPFTIEDGNRFAPSSTMLTWVHRAELSAMAFAGIALSAIMAWTLHTRIP